MSFYDDWITNHPDDAKKAVNVEWVLKFLDSRWCPYKIGDLYLTTESTPPYMKFPNTEWIDYGGGRVIVGAGTSDRTFAINEIGGSSTVTLTTAQMPSHTHPISSDGNHTHTVHAYQTGSSSGGNNKSAGKDDMGSNSDRTSSTAGAHTHTLTSTGSGAEHNNLQPYITCYVWKRTA
jgi:hypothetical protein